MCLAFCLSKDASSMHALSSFALSIDMSGSAGARASGREEAAPTARALVPFKGPGASENLETREAFRKL